MKIYKRIYDNPIDENGNEKPNEFLGEFDLIEGDMNDYSYEVIVKSKETGELFILFGKEISGFYNKGLGGTSHTIEKLTDNKFVKAYINNTTSEESKTCIAGFNNCRNQMSFNRPTRKPKPKRWTRKYTCPSCGVKTGSNHTKKCKFKY